MYEDKTDEEKLSCDLLIKEIKELAITGHPSFYAYLPEPWVGWKVAQELMTWPDRPSALSVSNMRATGASGGPIHLFVRW